MLLAVLAATLALSVDVPTGAARLSRRAVVPSALAALALPAASASAASADLALAQDVTAVKLLAVKAKALRATVRSSAGNRRSLPMDATPGVNNYASTTLAVRRAQAQVLVPLQAKMSAVAAAPTGLPDELQKSLALQPLLMKGHLLELEQALGAYAFAEYRSKTTGDVYPGGKVERELEEVCETADDFLELLRGRAVAPRED
jgi:hypothetical protein